MKKIGFALMSSFMLSFGVVGQQDTLTKGSNEERIKQIENRLSKFGKFKITGYLQPSFQYGEEFAKLNVGTPNSNTKEDFNRFGIRRGRIKLTYTHNVVTGVFQVDMTERGLAMRDAYMKVQEPWLKTFSLTAGLFDTPFSYEIMYSSSRRESPERARIFPTLFPKEKDLGVMLTIQASKINLWNMLKLDLGLFSGNGVNLDIDNRKNLITRLRVDYTFKNDTKIGGGISYYNGSVYQGTKNVYRFSNNLYLLNSDTANVGAFGRREYYGADFQLRVRTILGETKLTGDYIFGYQSGSKDNSESYHASSLPTTDTYIRNFQGGYVMLVQSLGKLPLYAILKYDIYDPNIKISGNTIGLNNTGKADVMYQTYGFGLEWKAMDNLRITAYYDWIHQEKSANLVGYEKDRKDNVFTLRMHYNF